MRRLLSAILLLVSMPAVADDTLSTLSPASARYEVRLNNLPFKAKASQTLSALGGDRWRLELRVDSFLLDTVEYSEFRWDGEHCHTIPEHYFYSRKGISRKKQLDLKFDHANGQVTRNDGKETSTYAINEKTEDKLGHTLALACRVARGARGAIAVNVAWDRDVRHLDYLVSGNEEAIDTPLGTFQALRMERTRVDSDRITTSWISSAAGWQPVKMQHTEGDGRLFQLRLLDLDHAEIR